MKKGFTLLEVLIGMTAAAIVFSAASALMISVARSNVTENKEEVLNQSINDLAVDIINYVRWADTIVCQSGKLSAEFFDPVVGTIKHSYELTSNGDQSYISKDGSALTSPKNVLITEFNCEAYDDDSINVNLGFQSKNDADMKDTVSLVISPRNRI